MATRYKTFSDKKKYRALYVEEPRPEPTTHEVIVSSDHEFNPDDPDNRMTADGGMIVEVLDVDDEREVEHTVNPAGVDESDLDG